MSLSFTSSSHPRTSQLHFKANLPQRRHFVSRSVLCFNRHDSRPVAANQLTSCVLTSTCQHLWSQSWRAVAGDSRATNPRQTAERATWLSCQFCTAHSRAAGASKQCTRRYARAFRGEQELGMSIHCRAIVLQDLLKTLLCCTVLYACTLTCNHHGLCNAQ